MTLDNSRITLCIAFSHDPIYITPFIERIIIKYHSSIKLVICTKGSIMKRKSFFKKVSYFFTLILILGVKQSLKNIFLILINSKKSKLRIVNLCKEYGISFIVVNSINSKTAIDKITNYNIDLLFNQSQHILKKDVLNSVKLGVFNRHGGLLPKYRGRLTPFWQLYHKEKYGGMTYHAVNENIDSGPIIYQKKIPIDSNETFSSLIKKMFDNSVTYFQLVLDFYKSENYVDNFIKNDGAKKSYFSYPTIKDALRYRVNLWKN